MNSKFIFVTFSSVLALLSCGAYGQDQSVQIESESSNRSVSEITEVYITGGKTAIETMPGSAALVDESEIATFISTDINSLLGKVPGVYIRQEDGYGLRPNIGLRGTSSERSTKITLMEDGILIAPAPYAAPAAYYTPNVASMSAVEVFKGPSAVRYGPHTVGGAINFVTRPVSSAAENEIELALGDNAFRKLRGFGTYTEGQYGFWVDALHYGADGFKKLNSNADTGFIRNSLNTKLQWLSPEGASVDQALQIKLGYADEDSDETYLGLSDEDFSKNPLERYSASQLDKFDSEHTQVHALYSADFNNGWMLNSKAWRNDFDRSWNKFNGFVGGVDIEAVLAAPNVFADDMDILRGAGNSEIASQLIDITNNQRDYVSQGVEFDVSYEAEWFGWGHALEAGVRYSNDYVNRNHVQRGYLMQDNVLVFDGSTVEVVGLNRGEADALALFVKDEILLDKWLISLGLRSETIDSEHRDFRVGNESFISDTQDVLLPGAGAYYTVNDQFGVLVGINKGFSAKAASSAEDVDPEESVNYEYGFRFRTDQGNVEMIGFFSDYTNLLGRCRVVDSSCDSDVNGGSATVSGIEFTAGYQHSAGGYTFPVDLVYTYTEGQFESSFESGFNQWGGDDNFVNKGDELPYLPTHQGQLQLGIEAQDWSVNLALKYTGEMREQAGQGGSDDDTILKALTTADVAYRYSLSPKIEIKFVVENITDNIEIVSRRPIGARPNHPRMLKLGAHFRF